MRVYLVGAGNRAEFAQLLERKLRAYPQLEIFSIESSLRTPISRFFPTIQTDLKFQDPEFPHFLKSLPDSEESAFLALMDAAIPAVVQANVNTPSNQDSVQVCDKSWLKNLARSKGLAVPSEIERGWAHVKPKKGNGSAGIRKEFLGDEFRKLDDFLYEEIIEGDEVSIDAYRFKDGTFKAIARDRIRVVGGEVQHTRTRELTRIEFATIQKLLDSTNLRGPLNIQLMGESSTLLEINPRFGGGSTASIRAGWNGFEWFLLEYALDREVINPSVEYKHVEVIRAWADYQWEV